MKNLLNLGKVLSKAQQKEINGGGYGFCCERCPDGSCNSWVSHPRVRCPFTAGC